jgi:drug/metabolite transporter (DMT)-like permease
MPVEGFSLVVNIFFGHYWLKEKLAKNDLYGTILIVFGAVMVAVFGSHESTSYTLEELLVLYYRWDMVFYALFIAMILIAL